MEIKYFSSNDNTLEPAHSDDAGLDLRADDAYYINAGCTQVIGTGIYVEIPEGYFGWVADRSSMAKNGLQTAGGIIDAGYRGEIHVVITNHNTNEDYVIRKGDKIAQLIVIPCFNKTVKVDKLEDLSSTERGTSGFGSTGK